MPAPTLVFPKISRPSFLKVTYPFFHDVDQLQEEVREDEGQVHLSCGHSGAPAYHQSQQANQRCKYRSQEPAFSGPGAFAQLGAIVDCHASEMQGERGKGAACLPHTELCLLSHGRLAIQIGKPASGASGPCRWLRTPIGFIDLPFPPIHFPFVF